MTLKKCSYEERGSKPQEVHAIQTDDMLMSSMHTATDITSDDEGSGSKNTGWVSKIVLVICVIVCIGLYVLVPSVNEWVNNVVYMFQVGNFTAMKEFIAQYGIYAALISFFLMVFQSIAAPLPAFFITLTNANLFGWWQGAILSWSSAMAGAALCFLIARILGRDVVEKICTKGVLKQIDDFFDKYGSKSILIARLLPFMSFDFVSYAAGLTKMGFGKFFLATGIGQLPATIVYSYVGGMLTGGAYYLFLGLLCLFALAILVTILKTAWNKKQEKEAAAAAAEGREIEPREPARIRVLVSKLYNCLLWAFVGVLFASMSVWLTMRINMGWIFFGLLILLLVVFLCIRRLQMGIRFTVINTVVCVVVSLVVFGPEKLLNTPAAYVRSGLGQTHWPLGIINAVILSILIIGFLLVMILFSINARKQARTEIPRGSAFEGENFDTPDKSDQSAVLTVEQSQTDAYSPAAEEAV